jgi:guanine deaminase
MNSSPLIPVAIFDTEASRGVGALDFFDAECGREFEIDEQAVEKWWCVGDVRNRRAMWVQGKKC